MKKTIKIIIALGVLVVVAATVLTVSLIAGDGGKGNGNTEPSSLYTLAPSTVSPTLANDTEAWVDLDLLASELATASDTTDTSDTSSTSEVLTTLNSYQPLTTIIYVYETVVATAVPSTTQNVTQNELTEKETSNVMAEPEMTEFKYTIDSQSKTATLDKYLGDSSVVWLPETVGGYEVTAIGDKCFENASMTAVCIREGVKTIGNSAFLNCKNLTNITFLGVPYTVTVGDNAFKNCAKLKTINLPAASSIGKFAFDGCKSLETITLKDGTESIGDYCFTNCTNLKSITIPESVTYIGTGAFSNPNENLVIKCVKGSVADDKAAQYEIKTEYVG